MISWSLPQLLDCMRQKQGLLPASGVEGDFRGVRLIDHNRLSTQLSTALLRGSALIVKRLQLPSDKMYTGYEHIHILIQVSQLL